MGLDKTWSFQNSLGSERKLDKMGRAWKLAISLGNRQSAGGLLGGGSARHILSLEICLCVPSLNGLAVRGPVEEERRRHEPARRGQYRLTHESRRFPQPLPLLASPPLLDRLVPALLPVSGEAGVSGSGSHLS